MLTRIEVAAAVMLTLAAAVLHFVVMRNAGGMWRDEINSIGIAQASSLKEFSELFRIEIFPAAYFLLLRAWMMVAGSGDEAIKALVFLVGISILLGLWFNARVLGRSWPLISLAVFGMNAFVIWHGDMVRSYGIGTLFMLLTVGLVWKLVMAPTRWLAILATLSAIGATHSLYQNSLFVLAICLAGATVAARQRHRDRAVLILGVGAFTALCLVPYVPLVIARASESVVLDQGEFSLSQALTVAMQTLNSSGVFMAGVWVTLLLLAAGMAIAAQWPAVFGLLPDRRDVALYCGLTLVMALAGFCLLFFVYLRFGMAPRYYPLPLALAAVFLDVMIAALPATLPRRMVVICGSIMIAAGSFPNAWAQSHQRHTNLDQIAAEVESLAARDDLIVVLPCIYGATFHRYYRGSAPWISLPELEDFRIQRDDLWKAKLATPNATASALAKVSETLRSGHKVWVVGEPIFPGRGQLPPVLPPAPGGPQGWYAAPYERMWAMELGHLLQSQAGRQRLVRPRSDNAHPDENLPVMVFEGRKQP